jgi:uncharacterized protein YjbI with pentapeptide repeats
MPRPVAPKPRSVGRHLTSTTLCALTACLSISACAAPEDLDGPVDRTATDLVGENLGGKNLAGANLAGSNLAGANLAGANLGGVNLAGSNLAGANLSGTNLGGNNLAGNNLAGSNLSGSNLAGSNLAGSNLAGSNLAGSNLSGSNLAGSNLAGNSVAGTNLGSTTLTDLNTARNIHALSGSVAGMLYSGEDLWTPKTAQCVVMGIGSTAFGKLLGQQSAGARMSVALGKLPWGFAASAGGPVALQAWEAVAWGDKTYCVFLLAAPPGSTWAGVAGFIKAVFRWNAPVGQSMDISGIEASAPYDSTLSTGVTTYTGMMDAAARFRAGSITDTALVAGELAFASATTNNQSVLVDFSAWVQDKNKNPLVLGNVTSTSPPTYAEALYIALDNGDGTVRIILDDAASRTKIMPAGMTNSVVDLNAAYLGWQAGLGPKPVPRRCGGALYLNTWFGEPVPAGKCDDGLTWAPGFCERGSDAWTAVPGTTGAMNTYMQLTQSGGGYQRALISGSSCGAMKTVLSETYVHMWDRNFDIPVSSSCATESDSSFCARFGKNCGSVSGTDNCGNSRTVASCGGCASGQSCGGSGVPNVCGTSDSKIYEAEGLGNNLAGSSVVSVCPEAYSKVLGANDPGTTIGACAGGAKIRYIGGSSSNYVTFNKVNVPSTGTYTLTVYAVTKDPRTFYVSINGGSSFTMNMDGPDWTTPVAVTKNVSLTAGNNSIKFYNSSASTPDLDRIKVTATSICVAESNTAFCTRLAKNCGQVTANDNCGNSRTVTSCGSCASPDTCGGGGTANMCGGGGAGSCAVAYAQGNCLGYTAGTVVASGGHNWTCATGNCMNCATNAGCAPGGTTCPWGAVWTDKGSCGGSSGSSSTTTTCATAYATLSCHSYVAGTVVASGGHNWTCTNGNCANCAGTASCAPGASGCPWGTVWSDGGACH